MRRLSVIVLCGCGVVFIGLLLAGALTIRRGFSARNEPSAIESFVARYIRHMAVPRDAVEAKNPVPESAEVLAEAMAHFADHCAFCHGNDGSGATPIGQGLYPNPPDMRLAATQNLTDGEIFYVIQNGVRLTGMPAFGDNKNGAHDEDSWKLVYFIRRLPKITTEELEAMKKMNPKSPAELAEEEALEKFLKGEDVDPQPEHKHH